MTPAPASPQIGLRAAEHVRGSVDPFPRSLSLAQAAERAGYDGVFFGDRMLASVSAAVGNIYTATASEIIVTLAAVAASTRRIKLAPLVLVAPFRQPVLLAKTLASLDLLSKGRLILPLGAGWNEKEFQVVGLDRSEATARLTESIEILRQLMSGNRVTHHGRFYQLEDVQIAPVYGERRCPPIWLGSYTPMGDHRSDAEKRKRWSRLAHRVGSTAEGWVPLLYSQFLKRRVEPEALGTMWELVQEASRAGGHNIDFIFSHHAFIVDNAKDKPRLESALASFFGGTVEQAKDTYLIGTADEIVERTSMLLSHVGKPSWIILSLLEPSQRQFRLLTEQVIPQLRTV